MFQLDGGSDMIGVIGASYLFDFVFKAYLTQNELKIIINNSVKYKFFL